MLLPFFTVILVAVAVTAFQLDGKLQTDKIIDVVVNSTQESWTAESENHEHIKKCNLTNLSGTVTNIIEDFEDDKDHEFRSFQYSDLPVNFDAREKWKDCPSLQEVTDQGSCGSCWAVSSSSAFTDRLCIATNGSFNGHLSAQQLMTCCSECGKGCAGGSPGDAWEYFKTHGLVSGGGYGSNEGCQPYTIPECQHYVSGPRVNCTDNYENATTPECSPKECVEEFKESSFQDDLHKVILTFEVNTTSPGVHNSLGFVQKEIYENGPMTTTFAVYEDFLEYKSGIYQHKKGQFKYGHVVKVIGWGMEEGTPYWLVANSWNSDWGDKGFFKIRRGNNECSFEELFNGGVPDISKYTFDSVLL